MNIRRQIKAHKAEVHTGPLNDILFILLLFFLIVSTLANPNVKKVNTPKGKGDSRVRQNIMIAVTADHKIFIGQKEVAFIGLDSVLKNEIVQTGIDSPHVIVRCDTLAYFGEAYKIMEAAKRAGGKVLINLKGD